MIAIIFTTLCLVQGIAADYPEERREAASTTGMRVHIVRLRPGEDLLAGIQRYAERHKFPAGIVLTTVGSLAETRVRLANRPEATRFKGKVEIVSLVGTIDAGTAHLHLSVSDRNGKTIGGHLVEGCTIFTTAEIAIGELLGLSVFTRAGCCEWLRRIEDQPEPLRPGESYFDMYKYKLNRLAVFVFLCIAPARGEESLKLNQTVKRSLAAGASAVYEINLKAGDYVGGEVTQTERTDLMVLRPDGSRWRTFAGPEGEDEWDISFVAEVSGPHRLVMKAAETPTRYELQVTELISLEVRLRPDPPKDKSKRIAALRKQIAGGNKDTRTFWAEVERSGTPLTEPIEGDAANVLATFVWRGNAETRNVLLTGSYQISFGLDLENQLTRLADSDVWYLTKKMPTGARFRYRFYPNDPLKSGGPYASKHAGQADPFNPKQWMCT